MEAINLYIPLEELNKLVKSQVVDCRGFSDVTFIPIRASINETNLGIDISVVATTGEVEYSYSNFLHHVRFGD